MDDGRTTAGLEVARDRMFGNDIHDALASTQVLGLVMSLRARIGDELMADIAGASVAAIDEWCEGWLELPPAVEARLRLVDTILGSFDDHRVSELVSHEWFTTPNLSLGGRTPASVVQTGEPTDVAPALLVAARASIS